ncbi:MAG: hypothetical protein OEW58_02025, partial [Gammaproteobacteria bacterium]|nr:hypothetical protein [Gammaproteobacteria bacterium]
SDGWDWVKVSNSLPEDTDIVDAAAFSHIGKMWLKAKTSVWNSYDGISWQLVTANGVGSGWKGFVLFGGRVWAWEKNLYFSDTGSVWTAQSLPSGVADVTAVGVHANRMWLLSGRNVYVSADGKTFSLVNSQVPFAARSLAALQSFKGRLWMIGGGYTNDIWSSADGSVWRPEHGMNSYAGTVGERGVLQVAEHGGTLFANLGSDIWRMNADLSWQYLGRTPSVAKGSVDLLGFDNRLWQSKITTFIDSNGLEQVATLVFSSVDGQFWTERAKMLGTYHFLLAKDGELQLRSADLAATYWTSPDGTNWSETAPYDVTETPPDLLASHITIGGSTLYALGKTAAGQVDTLLQSADGRTWTPLLVDQQFLPADYRVLTGMFWVANRLWLLGIRSGGESFSLSTETLTGWTMQRSPVSLPVVGSAMIDFNGQAWLLGGSSLQISPTAGVFFRTANVAPWRTEVQPGVSPVWRRGQPAYFRFE